MIARLLLPLSALLLTHCVQPVPQAGYPAQPPQANYPAPSQPQMEPPVSPAPAPPSDSAPAYPQSAPVSSPSSQADVWQRTSSVRSSALDAGAQFHAFTARSSTGADSAQIEVVTFDSSHCALRVLDQPSSNAGGSALTSLMRGAGAIAGVNGGFFHPDFSTLGLMIADGQTTGHFAKTSLVSGAVLMIGREPYLVWNHEFQGPRGVTQMLQAGPRLVDDGQPIRSLNRTKTSLRTFVATDGGRHWAIGIVRYTTLAGLGELLASPGLIPGVRVQRALNLDGGRSTALYVRKADGEEIRQPGWSTVRNYLAVVPR